ncbi:MAG: cell division protein FtsL [Proteobacteria bacterium]|nr:cell division protein FtsL [Pseudomonadota bacterium]
MSSRAVHLAVAGLWVGVLASSAGAIYLKHESRTLFIELEKLSAERDQLNIEWGRLQLEQSAWSAHGFVEQVANRQLQLTFPSATEVKIVQP